MGLKQTQVRISVVGHVQGVFFRACVKEIADSLGIMGWVKNESDGSVAIVAEGRERDLQKLIKWCKRGTELSRVEDVKIEWRESTSEFKEFTLQ